MIEALFPLTYEDLWRAFVALATQLGSAIYLTHGDLFFLHKDRNTFQQDGKLPQIRGNRC
jgi:hypothetical protein